ncbi:sensor histidine kinase [Allonocardiopsis opalescens]|uniref:Oxygen sensor histidine kinase NreB n=1 Tax=Allonocardiopsis opalescens TaxID=1144618 RepID=A0A2T0Q5I0_9ACTN|nr:sensor histidine kinase [Allonocardiopsis opalescens]PRX99044.1 signal transduction histidine kinase [Allonocardiopsis opalescens]
MIPETGRPDGTPLARWAVRLGRGGAVAPYLLLAASTVATVLDPQHSVQHRLVTVALAVCTAVWLAALGPRPGAVRGPVLDAVFCVGVLALIVLLVTRGSWFGLFAFMGYVYSWYQLPGLWRLLGVAVAAGASTGWWAWGAEGFASATPAGIATYLVVVGTIVVLVAIFSSMGQLTEARSERRGRMVAELAEANEKLAATMRENEGLHAQLLAQAHEAGVLDERQRLAREIHDTLAQGLTGIITQLEAADQATEPAAHRRHLDNAAGLARSSLAEARRSVHALRPEALEASRLPDALAEVARAWSQMHGVPAEVAVTGEPLPLSADADVTLLRTAQEALANTARHAGARRVGLTLSYLEDAVILDVRDDGAGFEPAAPVGPRPDGGGFGLTAMRQRLERLGGRLEVESEPGAGTAVSATLYAPRAAASA